MVENMIESAANPSLWAQTGGMNGLVIFALFAALAMFLRAQTKIYEMHRNDLRQLLELHAKERESWGHIVDTRQQETNQAINAMTATLNKLANRKRGEDE